MYTQRDAASACIRLLNASCVIGCAADMEQGPLLHVANALIDIVPNHPAGVTPNTVCATQQTVLVHSLSEKLYW